MLESFEQCLVVVPDGVLDARALPTHGGVFLIEDRDGRLVLLASAENLRRVVGGRLTSPPPDQRTKRANLAEVAACVRWRSTFSRFETTLEYWRLARVFDPQGYRRQIGFGPAWFLRVEVTERTPRFEVVNAFQADGARCFGPFATRQDADEWVHLLEDLFDLCRYHPILVQAPAGQACAYAEMGKCPAPCNGSISLEDYRRMVIEAADFTAGNHQPRPAALRATMAAAAADLAFEKAAALRQTIERAEAVVKKPAFRLLAELPRLCWLVVQRGGPRRRSARNALVKPFHIRTGAIEVGEAVKLDGIEAAVPAWLNGCQAGAIPLPASKDEQTARCEVLWLVSKFLFQGEKAPGLFLRFDQLPDAAGLADLVRRAVSRSDEATEQEPPALAGG